MFRVHFCLVVLLKFKGKLLDVVILFCAVESIGISEFQHLRLLHETGGRALVVRNLLFQSQIRIFVYMNQPWNPLWSGSHAYKNCVYIQHPMELYGQVWGIDELLSIFLSLFHTSNACFGDPHRAPTKNPLPRHLKRPSHTWRRRQRALFGANCRNLRASKSVVGYFSKWRHTAVTAGLNWFGQHLSWSFKRFHLNRTLGPKNTGKIQTAPTTVDFRFFI